MSESPPTEKAQNGVAARPSAEYFKLAAVAAVIIAVIVVVSMTPLRGLLRQVNTIQERLDGLGPAAPIVFTAAVALFVALGVPRLLFCPIGGVAFGFWQGLLWAQIGTVAGSYATFLFVRWGGREFVLRKWPRARGYAERFKARGALSVLLMRQIPVSSFLISSVLGLTHVSHAAFLAGTAAGVMPEAIPATLLGAGTAQASTAKAVFCVAVALLWLIIAALVLRKYRRRLQPKGGLAATLGRQPEGDDAGKAG